MQISITLHNISKKYINEWIFRDLSYTINPSDKLVILGSNGSGKSTLLQTIASYLIPSGGEVHWQNGAEKIADEHIFQKLSMASPYMELIEDFTLRESIDHQRKFKPFSKDLSTKEILSILELDHAADKFLKNFSSGMRQRVKLGLAILADCPVLLLDEPCTNLDAKSISWYQNSIQKYALDKTIVVCSNTVKEEYAFCTSTMEVEKFKS